MVGAAIGSLTAAGVAYLVAGVINQALSATATYLGAYVGWAATNELREDLADHLLHLDMGFHTNTTPGELIERVDGDVTAVANFLARFVVRLLGSGLLLVGVLVVSWFQNVWMGVGITVYVTAVTVLIVRMRKLAVQASEEEREVSARLYGFIEERLAGVDDIRANGAGGFVMWRFIPVMRDFYVPHFSGLAQTHPVLALVESRVLDGRRHGLDARSVAGDPQRGHSRHRISHSPICPVGASPDRTGGPGISGTPEGGGRDHPHRSAPRFVIRPGRIG